MTDASYGRQRGLAAVDAWNRAATIIYLAFAHVRRTVTDSDAEVISVQDGLAHEYPRAEVCEKPSHCFFLMISIECTSCHTTVVTSRISLKGFWIFLELRSRLVSYRSPQ